MMTANKTAKIFLRILQLVVLYLTYKLPSIYGNRLNFMRSVVYHSKNLNAENPLWLTILPLFVGLVGAYLAYRCFCKQRVIALVIAVATVGWALLGSTELTPIYYLYLLMLIVLFVLQWLYILVDEKHILKGKRSR